jgi:ubiquinone/menaquinone biosynthesis C-methylase UbiE
MKPEQTKTEQTDADAPGSHQPRPREGWQLAGTVPENYERYLVPVFFAPWAERMVELAGVRPDDRVLDVACGTGIVARRAAARVGAGGMVVGVDVNDAMLKVAAATAEDVRPVIRWQSGDTADLPFPDMEFDAVFCQQGLQFFTDQVAAVREMRRVLAPGGRLTLAVWRSVEHSPGFVVLAQVLERHAGPDVGAMMRSPFAGPDADAMRKLLTAAGFSAVRCQVGIGTVRFPSPEEFVRRETISSPLAGPIAALGTEIHEAITRDLAEALRPHTDDDGVVFPMETWLLTARR